MAKDGFHALLVVFSVRTRFSEEEEATLRVVQTLFGHKIIDYMIIVFTGGDELEYNKETLDDYLGQECPQPLKVSYHIIIYMRICVNIKKLLNIMMCISLFKFRCNVLPIKYFPYLYFSLSIYIRLKFLNIPLLEYTCLSLGVTSTLVVLYMVNFFKIINSRYFICSYNMTIFFLNI